MLESYLMQFELKIIRAKFADFLKSCIAHASVNHDVCGNLIYMLYLHFQGILSISQDFLSICRSSMALNKLLVVIPTYIEVDDRFFRCFKKVT